MNIGRLLAWTFLALAGVQVVLGAVWSARNFAKIPHYGDSFEMVETAETLVFVEGRMLAYPWLLRGVQACLGDEWMPADPHFRDEDWARVRRGEAIACAAPAWTGAVQALQLLALLAAFAAAIRIVTRSTWLFAGCLSTLLVSDPWILHHVSALMTDALALGALALFAAAATAYLERGRAFVLAGICAAQVAAGTLRWEKSLVIVAAAAGVLLGTLLLARRRGDGGGPPLRRRALLLFGVTLLSYPLVGAINGLAEVRPLLFSPMQYWLHQRVIAGHVDEVYDDLSPETRALFSREQAVRYDLGVAMQRRVMPEVTGGDREVLTALTDDLAEVVWREKAGAIVREISMDVVRYLVPGPFCRRRIHLWEETFAHVDSPPAATLLWDPFEAAGAYCLNKFHEPRASERAWHAASLLAVVGSVGGALLLLGRVRRMAWLGSPTGLARWLPLTALVGANACAFALSFDLFEMRYALPSHAALLALLYGVTLRAAFRASGVERS